MFNQALTEEATDLFIQMVKYSSTHTILSTLEDTTIPDLIARAIDLGKRVAKFDAPGFNIENSEAFIKAEKARVLWESTSYNSYNFSRNRFCQFSS